MQIALRRQLILHKRASCKNIWPIDENAGNAPQGWSGWPGGKKFALVLTHDVEAAKGQDKCSQLMELEKTLGFRSSFNFVPRRYPVSANLRKSLVSEGFEVGVHGLYHDGKYYHSQDLFRERAKEINKYLKSWGAVGFRSPAMLHNLDWIRDLNIEYDASTFDSDPFEPQPDGMGTIFPFYVNGDSSRKGYIELPYTLPQDFTLFNLMKENDIDIWKKKLDWIADKGGMGLVNVHPDYMNFDESSLGVEEYPARFYKDFLEYIKEKYAGQYWHVLPREMAEFCNSLRQNSDGGLKRYISSAETVKPRILMIVEYSYPSDTRVRKEATTLKDSFDVTVISLKRHYKKWHEHVDGVEVFRIPEIVLPMNSSRNRLIRLLVSIMNYTLQYSFFTSVSLGLFLLTHIRRRYKVIHAHNPPDTLFLVGLIGKLFSVKFVYDHHDLAPDLYLSRYMGKTDIAHKILLLCEKLSCKLADVVIATNASYKEIEITRHGIEPDKIRIVRNDPIIKEFSGNSDKTKRENNRKITILYIGSINPQDGVEILLDVLNYLVNHLSEKNILCRIVGNGDSLEDLKTRAVELDLMDYLEFTGYIYEREKIKYYLETSDICVEPAPSSALNDHSTFIKIMEYMAVSKPIVAFDLKESRYSADGCAILVRPGDIEGFALAIKNLLDDDLLRHRLGKAGFTRIQNELNWSNASIDLIEAYKTMFPSAGSTAHDD